MLKLRGRGRARGVEACSAVENAGNDAAAAWNRRCCRTSCWFSGATRSGSARFRCCERTFPPIEMVGQTFCVRVALETDCTSSLPPRILLKVCVGEQNAGVGGGQGGR
uniref:(northern house mosquito) hypothetical protein n=1 Tax=Culex pipiens TaxID=7175 RepID=A0A8D8BV47_CULPI